MTPPPTTNGGGDRPRPVVLTRETLIPLGIALAVSAGIMTLLVNLNTRLINIERDVGEVKQGQAESQDNMRDLARDMREMGSEHVTRKELTAYVKLMQATGIPAPDFP